MPEPLRFLLNRLPTPIGEMLILTDDDGYLRVTSWDDHEPRMRVWLERTYRKQGVAVEENSTPNDITRAMERYFAGDLTVIDKIPTKTNGTAFQRQVWQALREIPCGTTISYGELAKRIGRPKAVRAVGLANGSNPISIVIPCYNEAKTIRTIVERVRAARQLVPCPRRQGRVEHGSRVVVNRAVRHRADDPCAERGE